MGKGGELLICLFILAEWELRVSVVMGYALLTEEFLGMAGGLDTDIGQGFCGMYWASTVCLHKKLL